MKGDYPQMKTTTITEKHCKAAARRQRRAQFQLVFLAATFGAVIGGLFVRLIMTSGK